MERESVYSETGVIGGHTILAFIGTPTQTDTFTNQDTDKSKSIHKSFLPIFLLIKHRDRMIYSFVYSSSKPHILFLFFNLLCVNHFKVLLKARNKEMLANTIKSKEQKKQTKKSKKQTNPHTTKKKLAKKKANNKNKNQTPQKDKIPPKQK